MIARGDVWEADIAEFGRRPCVVITRDEAIAVLARINIVTVSETLRGHPAEVQLDERHGLNGVCAANCDTLANVAKSALLLYRGTLDPATLRRLDEALRIALDL